MSIRIVIFILTLLPMVNAAGQSNALEDLMNCFDEQYGANNLLINGRSYTPSHPKAEGHPYFLSEDWRPGRVFVNGSSYPVHLLKYNLFSQQLIVKHERGNGTTQEVVLSDLLVDSFQIGENLFVNRDFILPEAELSDYLEKYFEDELAFYRLQRMVFGPLSNTRPYGEYSSLRDVYYLILKGQKYKITGKKEFLDYFPRHKAKIKKYMKTHSMRWKKMNKIQFVQLLKYCNDRI